MSMKQIILSFSFGQCFLKKSAQKSWLYVCNSKFGEMYYIKVKHGIWYDCNPPSPTYLGKIFWCSFHYPKVPLKPVPPPPTPPTFWCFLCPWLKGHIIWSHICCVKPSVTIFGYCKQLNCNSLCRWSISSPKELQYNRKCHALIHCITSSYLGNKLRLNNISHYPDFIPCVGQGSKGPFQSKV
jgi:hypothetical protein